MADSVPRHAQGGLDDGPHVGAIRLASRMRPSIRRLRTMTRMRSAQATESWSSSRRSRTPSSAPASASASCRLPIMAASGLLIRGPRSRPGYRPTPGDRTMSCSWSFRWVVTSVTMARTPDSPSIRLMAIQAQARAVGPPELALDAVRGRGSTGQVVEPALEGGARIHVYYFADCRPSQGLRVPADQVGHPPVQLGGPTPVEHPDAFLRGLDDAAKAGLALGEQSCAACARGRPRPRRAPAGPTGPGAAGWTSGRSPWLPTG